jgi:hypothetical protein
MSKMIPDSLVNTLRSFVNNSVDIYGQDVTLYIPTNWETVDQDDVYSEPGDYTFDSYSTTAFIHWNMNKHKLIKLGLYVEEDIPIVAYFSDKIKDDSGFKHYKSIPQNSYIQVPIQFVPNNFKTDSFEVVDIVIDKMQDKSVRKFYKLVPKRTRGVE